MKKHDGSKENMSKINVVLGNIVLLDVEAIVNAANSSLLGGGGVDGAIHRAAGAELLNECKTLNGCKTGHAKITKGYKLKAKHVIHTVGPIWFNGNENEEVLLKDCYNNCLAIANNNKITSIAFPCISTGIYGFPQKIAAQIAVEAVSDFITKEQQIEQIIFCCFLKEDFELYTKLICN